METVHVIIDGQPLSVQKGRTVLEAAIEHGYQVPFYCYHPALGVDGSCRVCIVKIEKMPKLQTACSTVCADGMIVYTQTPDVVEARAGVFEFLLINHPLDCPVCDKGGECPLQDFSYTFGPAHSRMEFPRRVFDGEGARADVDFGPTLMLNRNRCILCTRCVRFMQQVDGDAQIGIVDRGSGSEIATFQERGVHSLLSGNLSDICPVGAITTRQYRFRSRPWDNPAAVDTLCTLCAKGCNTMAWVRAKPEWAKGPRVVRISPRLNPDVNGYWMCDIGRFEYDWIERENRLTRAMERDSRGVLQPVGWEQLMERLAAALNAARKKPGGLQFLISAHASLEEMFLFKRLAWAIAGEERSYLPWVSWRVSEKQQPPKTTFRVSPVDAPNVSGASDLGLIRGESDRPELSELKEAIDAGRVDGLYAFDSGPEGSIGDCQWVLTARQSGKLPLLIFQGVVASPLSAAADFVLPGAAFLEKNALYTNDQGRVQPGARVVSPPGEAAEDWLIVSKVAQAIGCAWEYSSADMVRSAISVELHEKPAYANLTSLTFGKAAPVRNWLQASNPSERHKWDILFRDVPPVKFSGTLEPTPRMDIIPLHLDDTR